MSWKNHIKITLLLCLVVPQLLHAGWHDRRCEGWAYYEEKVVPVDKEKVTSAKEKSPSERLEERRKEIEDQLALALLEPTEDNLYNYIELQRKCINQASDFSKVWAKVVLENPNLDYSISGTPVSSYGTKFHHNQKVALQKEIILELSKTYGLLCFYEGKSEASKELAKVIHLFSERYDWIIQPVSVDGIMIEEFPGSIKDHGLTKQLNVGHYPAIYVLNPKTRDFKPIGFGLVSVDMIETNIVLQFKEAFEKQQNMDNQ